MHVPIRTPHRFWNGGDEPGVFVCEIRLARRWEESIRTAFGLARDGKTNGGRDPDQRLVARVAL